MVDKEKERHIRVMGGMLLKGNIGFDVARFMKILQKLFIGAHLGSSEKFGTKRVIGSAFFYRVKSVRVVGATIFPVCNFFPIEMGYFFMEFK